MQVSPERIQRERSRMRRASVAVYVQIRNICSVDVPQHGAEVVGESRVNSVFVLFDFVGRQGWIPFRALLKLESVDGWINDVFSRPFGLRLSF